MTSRCRFAWILLAAPLARALDVRGVPTHRVPLHRADGDSSPYCLAASSTSELGPGDNFLATQVWPSAREAAITLRNYILQQNENDIKFSEIWEMGCGPGLPSLTAAATAAGVPGYEDLIVHSTDVDPLALELVNSAAKEQNLRNIDTHLLDLIEAVPETGDDAIGSADWRPLNDKSTLYVFSDVFESAAVARGAARFTQALMNDKYSNSYVWVFAQSDRAQREVYLQSMQETMGPDTTLLWKPWKEYYDEHRKNVGKKSEFKCKLWLCDLDETAAQYG